MKVRYAVLSDIHGNLHALEAVLADIERCAPDAVYCLGDVVGYGAFPNECVRRLQALGDGAEGARCLLGNHDEAALTGDIDRFNPVAGKAAQWTRAQLDADAAAWLGALPFTHTLPELLLVHASADQPAAWHYVTDEKSARRCMLAARQQFQRHTTLIGHSHFAAVVSLRPDAGAVKVALVGEGTVRLPLDGECSHVINVGSVGQPRDRDPRACYALVDVEPLTLTVTLRRVPYDVAAAQEAIRVAGLPDFLAERLAFGA